MSEIDPVLAHKTLTHLRHAMERLHAEKTCLVGAVQMLVQELSYARTHGGRLSPGSDVVELVKKTLQEVARES